MAALVTTTVTRLGAAGNPQSAAVGGDTCEAGSNVFLECRNTGGSAITVTLAIPSARSNYANVAYTSTAVTVPATTGIRRIGPLNAELYGDPTTGQVAITYSAVTGLTVEPIKVQQ